MLWLTLVSIDVFIYLLCRIRSIDHTKPDKRSTYKSTVSADYTRSVIVFKLCCEYS